MSYLKTLEEIKQFAVEYWQDRLAKFFPTSPGPTNTEVDMYTAGYTAGHDDGFENGVDYVVSGEMANDEMKEDALKDTY
jgi:uncharacterized membrane protein